MARAERDEAPAGPVIRSLVGTGFRIGDEVFPLGVKLTPAAAFGWTAPALAALSLDMLEDVLGVTPAPEFLLLGTGATPHWAPPELAAALDARGIGIEAMDSRAAARAWSVVRGEGRQVVAALLPLLP